MMYIKPDRHFAVKLSRFFLLYFIIYMLVSLFIRQEGEAFFSFSNFSTMVVMGSFMGIVFAVFDRERAKGKARLILFSKEHLRQILFGVMLFLLISIPLFLILYIIFGLVRGEKINLLIEFAKLGVFAITSAVLFSLLVWFRSRTTRI